MRSIACSAISSACRTSSRKVNADLNRKVDELAQANMALYESNRLKSDFLATMSHELRTPLNSILGFSDVLLSANLADKQQRWVGNIQSSGREAAASHQRHSRPGEDRGRQDAGPARGVQHRRVCDGRAEHVSAAWRRRRTSTCASQIDPDLPTLRQDLTKVQQILQNLLSNAIKFTPEGGRVRPEGGRRTAVHHRHCHRHRRRHRSRGAGARLPEVPPIRQSADARKRRHRSGSVDRAGNWRNF